MSVASSSTITSSSSSPITLANFINNRFVPPTEGAYLDNLNPATSQLLTRTPRSQASDINAAVLAAKAAFPSWSSLPFESRATFLEKMATAFESRLSHYASLESSDTGKPISLASKVDIPRAASNLRFFAGAIRHDETGAHAMGEAINYTQRSAVGVAGLITPWNLPIYLLTWKVAPALAMGNTVVIKPSELTPMLANSLAEIAVEVGLPAGVLNVVHGYGWEAGQALVEHPEVPLISFTGGTATGKKVAATAGPMFKKVSLELGGKNSNLIFADADFDLAVADAVRISFANQGQICLCGSRIVIESSIYDRFVKAFVEAVEKLKIGDPQDPTTTFGSLTSLPHREKIESYVELARSTPGAVIATGGKRPELPAPFSQGAYYSPTVILGLPPTHRCSVEEIFGPVVTIHKFDTEEEALEIVNNTSYGLAGSLWTSNVSRAHRVSKKWETGMVWVNTWLLRDLRVPFGGIKNSGVGTEGGKHSLEFYSLTKNICIFHGK